MFPNIVVIFPRINNFIIIDTSDGNTQLMFIPLPYIRHGWPNQSPIQCQRPSPTPSVLEEHYNEQSEADKRRLQRQFPNGD